MSETETGALMDGGDRPSARQHTAHLLKMLRGYGPASEPAAESIATPVASRAVTAAESSLPTMVADAAGTYGRLLDTPGRQPSGPPGAVSVQAGAVPAPHRQDRTVPAVGDLLRRQPGILGQLLAQADRLSQTNRIFQAYLPPHLRDHAILIELDEQNWTVQTDAASWATRLRYALPSIQQALGCQLGIELPKPHIRVKPPALPPQPQRPRLTLTKRNARLLEVAARNMPDARLSAALRRLATHAGAARRPAGSG